LSIIHINIQNVTLFSFLRHFHFLLMPEAFQVYLSDLVDERKAVWGGEPEVAALAAALKRPIQVFRALDEPLTLGAEYCSPDAAPLQIS
jgi:hypothetical protein